MEASSSLRPHKYVVLAMLFIAYLFNFMDRQLLGIIAVPLKAELALSDSQLGMMGGMAFALFYALLGVPAAWLADHVGRARVIGWSLVLWSFCTGLCGMAQGFWSLLLARMGVGTGEAGGVAPSYALLSQYFAPSLRARALGLYNLAIPVGSALAMAAGGALAAAWGWRAAFICMGSAGLLFAPIFFFVLRHARQMEKPVATPSLRATLHSLWAKPAFWALSLGAGCGSLIGYGLMFWLPSLFARRYDLGVAETGEMMALLFLVSGILGISAGGWLADYLGKYERSVYALVPALGYALCIPGYYWGLDMLSPHLALLWLLVPQSLSLIWMAPVTAAVQHLVAPAARSMASALFLLINNLVGLGLGSWVLGALSDHYGGRAGNGLLQALHLGLVAYGAAALCMLWASRTLARDWEAEA